MIRIACRAAAALAALLALAVPAQAKVWKEIYPLEAGTVRTVSSDGVTVTVKAPPLAAEDESEPDPDANTEDAIITVAFPGMDPVILPSDPYRSAHFGISVGIAKLNAADAQPTVLIAGYSGGAHCCGTLQFASAVEGVAIVDALPARDGDPMAALPTDLDKDGTLDIRSADDSLLYQFSSYAGSWPVPRIYNLREGFAYDVSSEPRYAKIFRKFAGEALDGCRSDKFESGGACAAHAYAMAVLGKAEEGIATALRYARPGGQLPYECLADYDENGNCPEGAELTFSNFEEALRWMMQQNGYLD